MNASASSILLSESAIQGRVAEIGTAISADYKDRSITIIGVLKGSFVFVADLMRRIDESIPVEVDFITVSSYRSGTTSSGEIKVQKDVDLSLEGKHVILVEDIIDTGLTLSRVRDLIESRGTESIRVATLLEKPAARKYAGVPDYVGFQIPDQFVVGYGMDHAERFRNLPDIRILDAF
jgi:hypoxanthine phosphoribosyltransferase